MAQLNRAMTSFYRLSINSIHVSICSGLTAILNAKLLPAAFTNVRRITVSYPSVNCAVRQQRQHSAYGTAVTLEIVFP